jgi:xanthine dehydrogenase accessory factor
VTPDILASLLAARAARQPIVLATRLPDGLQLLLPDQPAAPELQGERWFLAVHAPPPRLMVIGAVHIAQALAPIAAAAGLGVTVIDPRGGLATEERFPGIVLNHAWPDEALDALTIDRRTAIVALTHDPKLDDVALDRALRSEAFYIGALGSRKSHAKRLERLASLGHDADALGRISGPVGLPIGAVTPAEIGISILAEIIARRRGAVAA